MDCKADEFGAGPIVGHVADFSEDFAVEGLFFAPGAGGGGVVGEGVEDLSGLGSVTLPEPGVAVERGKIVPDAAGVPTGAIDHAFALGGIEHGEGTRDQRVV